MRQGKERALTTTRVIARVKTGSQVLPGPLPGTWIVIDPDDQPYLLDMEGNKSPLVPTGQLLKP